MIVMLYPGVMKPSVSNNLEIKFISIDEDIVYYNESVISVVPDLNLKEEWLNLLLQRYQSTLTYDDYVEYARAKEHYEDDIRRIMDDDRIPTIVINSTNCNIEELISQYMENKDE